MKAITDEDRKRFYEDIRAIADTRCVKNRKSDVSLYRITLGNKVKFRSKIRKSE